MWMAIYIGISFAISLILPFPISLIAFLGLFILINILRARNVLKKMSIDMKGLINRSQMQDYSPIKYYCMSCGKEHKEIECPNCGSKMKRVG
jgi:hypothetical protein